MWKKLFKKIKNTLLIIKEMRMTTVAGAWVYYFLLAVVPIAFLLFGAMSIFNIDFSLGYLSSLPEEFSTAITVIEQASKNVTKGVTVFIILTIVLSVSALLNQMSKDGAFIYGMEKRTKRGYVRRFWAVVALAVLFILFLCAAWLFSFQSKIFGKPRSRLVVLITTFTFVTLISFLIIAFLNRFISPVKLSLKETLMGSLISISFVITGTILFIVYVKFFSNYNGFYGVLSGVIVLLLWAYILMFGILSGVIVSMKAYFYRQSSKK